MLLYIVDWRMLVVKGGNVLHHEKREGKLSGGTVLGEYVREEYTQGECPDPDYNCVAKIKYLKIPINGTQTNNI